MKNKKSQEEMVGFVLIIILVSIIALVFLAISLRKQVPVENSLKVEDFLQASMKITTGCESSLGYLDLRSLIKSCLDRETCASGEESCKVLNSSLINIMENSWSVCQECAYSAYMLDMNYQNESFYKLDKGECKGSRTGEGLTFHYAGESVTINLELCSAELA